MNICRSLTGRQEKQPLLRCCAFISNCLINAWSNGEMPDYHISENATAGIGICVLIVLITIAVTIFILCGMKTKNMNLWKRKT